MLKKIIGRKNKVVVAGKHILPKEYLRQKKNHISLENMIFKFFNNKEGLTTAFLRPY